MCFSLTHMLYKIFLLPFINISNQKWFINFLVFKRCFLCLWFRAKWKRSNIRVYHTATDYLIWSLKYKLFTLRTRNTLWLLVIFYTTRTPRKVMYERNEIPIYVWYVHTLFFLFGSNSFYDIITPTIEINTSIF